MATVVTVILDIARCMSLKKTLNFSGTGCASIFMWNRDRERL
jgi:hypothetical protein